MRILTRRTAFPDLFEYTGTLYIYRAVNLSITIHVPRREVVEEAAGGMGPLCWVTGTHWQTPDRGEG